MTHIRYVRVSVGRLPQAAFVRTLMSRVMPARILTTGVLLIWSSFAFSQQFLVAGCDSTCLPAFDPVPADMMIDCSSDLPAFDLPAAAGCDDAPIDNTPHVELDEQTIVSYSLGTAFGPGDDWALWLGNFEAMGHGASDHFIPGADGVQFNVYANGTARITGRVVNDTDPGQQFDVDLFLQYGQDYDSWTAQGRFPKDDLGLMAYADWTFFEVVDTLSRLQGAGAYEGDVLYLDHMPVSRLFGFQLGANGANNRNVNFGISGWFWYRGVMGGNPVMGTGDVNADLTDETTVELECPVVASYERHAMAWSSCGHHVISYTIERHDLEGPIYDDVPPLLSADCTSLPDTADFSEFTVSDDCGGPLTLIVLSDVVEGEPCNQVLTRTWRLTDACGNSTDTAQMVTLVDTTGPSLFVSDVELACEQWADFTPASPVLEDNCTPADQLTWEVMESDPIGDFPSNFTLDLTYTATDLCGNMTEETVTVTVIDTIAPEFTSMVSDLDLTCSEWETYSIDLPEAMDNCDDGLAPTTVDTVMVEGPCAGTFTVLLTFTVQDAAGNATSMEQTIEVTDQEAPSFVQVPSDITLECGSPLPEDLPLATDNCSDPVTVEVSAVDSVPGDCPQNWVVTRTFSASDACGNVAVAEHTITIVDTEAPEMTDVPGDVVIACGETWPDDLPMAMDACGAVDSLWSTIDTLDVQLGTGFAEDFESCSLDGYVAEGGTISITNDAFDGSCALSMLHFAGDDPHNFYDPEVMAGRGTYRVMARADNFISDNGLKLLSGDALSSDEIGISLRPNGTDNPGISISGFGLDATADAVMAQGQWYEVEVELGESTLELRIDGLDVLSVTLPADLPDMGRVKLWSAYSGSYDDFSYQPEDACPVIERYRRNFYAVDLCGNERSAFQIVDVIDTVAPVLENLPADAVTDCGSDLPQHDVTAMDACTEANLSVQVDTLTVDCPGTLTLIRTFTATDACGNSVQGQQIIDVIDTVAPTLESLPEMTIQCDEALPTQLPMAEDNCSNPVTVELLSVDSLPGACPQDWEVTRTFLATDACGNEAQSSQLVHIVDTVAPVLVLALDSDTLECGSALPINLPIYADACDAMVNVMEVMPDTLPGACPGDYIVTRHFEATDACGNVSMTSQTVIFIDTVAPEFDFVPGPVTIQCDESLPTDLPTATDDCSGPVSIAVSSVDSVQGACPQSWEVTRTFLATDACGNEQQTSQIVTIEDTTAPEIDASTVPEDAFFSCAVEHPTCADFDVMAFDNCGSVTVACDMDTIPTECPATFTLAMTLTATDECANDTLVTVYFDVADTTAPALDLDLVPANDTIQCGQDPDLLESTDFSVEDDCSEWTFNASRETTGEEENPCNYFHTDTYTFTDCDGNETVFVHIITVVDTEGPSMSTAFDGQGPYFCAFEVPEYGMPITASMVTDEFPFDQVSDNCAAEDEIIITYSDSILAQNGENNFTVQRTWTLTDHCSNETKVIQVIIVEEPELILPNAFSPGNNNYNDRYVINDLSEVDTGDTTYPPCDWGPDDQQHFMVFNRWGSEVFSLPAGEPYRNDWDGRSNSGEPLVDGTYFVLLRLGERKLGQYVDLRNDK